MIQQMWRSAQFALLGFRQFTRDGYEKASKRFDNSVMERDMQGLVCYVTGANQGIGYQTSLDLAKRNATLYMVCRNQERGMAAVAKIQDATGNKDVHLKVCDISSLAEVRALAKEVEEDKQLCHILVNNAGCMRHNATEKSADGHEINFATNTLGTFALTSLMVPALLRGSASPQRCSRVITVTSGGMYTEALETEDFEMAKARKFDATVQYAKDKRRQVAMSERFSRLHERDGIKFVCMHPGWTATEGVKDALPGFSEQMAGRLRSLPEGADTIAWLALADADQLVPGGLYLDREIQAKHLYWAGTEYTDADVDRMWAGLVRMVGADTASN